MLQEAISGGLVSWLAETCMVNGEQGFVVDKGVALQCGPQANTGGHSSSAEGVLSTYLICLGLVGITDHWGEQYLLVYVQPVSRYASFVDKPTTQRR